MKMISKLITISLATSVVLSAAPITPGDILKQTKKPDIKIEKKDIPTLKSMEYKKPLIVKDTFTTEVKSFLFSGNSEILTKILEKLVKPYEKRKLGINKLKEITSIITKHYRDNGYFVARAYLPQQTIKDGIVEIAIIEGIYGNFKVKNNSHVEDSEVQSFMDYLKQGQKVSTFSLERQMLLINELSGTVVTNAEVYPGDIIGTSDFGITTEATDKYTGYGIFDNYGSKYTGEYRLTLGSSINSISNIGDSLNFSGVVSNTANLKNGQISYDRPLGYNGLKGGVSIALTDYKLDKIDNYEGYGKTNTVNAYINYPILKTRMRANNIGLYFSKKSMNDSTGISGSIDKSKKTITSATIKLDDKRATNFFNHQGRLYSTIGMTTGMVSLDNNVAVTNDASLNSEGNYKKINLDIFHIQQISKKLKLNTTFKAQKSLNKNLDSSEDISVSGSNGVRAYEDAELSGDKAYVLSLDLIYTLPKYKQITHDISLFVDSAKVWTNTKIFNNETNTRKLNAIGVGYEASYKDIDFKTSLAHGFGSDSTPTSESEFTTNRNKLLAQMVMKF